MSEINKVSSEFLGKVFDSYVDGQGYTMLGRFYAEEDGGYTAIDNTDGYAWTEPFVDEESAIYWLESGISVDDMEFDKDAGAYKKPTDKPEETTIKEQVLDAMQSWDSDRLRSELTAYILSDTVENLLESYHDEIICDENSTEFYEEEINDDETSEI